MPTIEERAQRCRTDTATVAHPWAVEATRIIDALLSTLDAERAAHAQFRQEVSDDLRQYFGFKINDVAQGFLGRFILTKPDPLVEVCADMGLGASVTAADDLRAALAKRGLKLVEVGDAD